MPEFKEREAARAARKAEELAPYVGGGLRAQAGDRRRSPTTDIPTYEAYGLTVTQPVDLDNMPEANRRRILTFKRMREIMEGR